VLFSRQRDIAIALVQKLGASLALAIDDQALSAGYDLADIQRSLGKNQHVGIAAFLQPSLRLQL
jgi:hypothetical protein